jgi:hypothetical protein
LVLAAKALAMRNILCGEPDTQEKNARREERPDYNKKGKGGG